LVRNLQKYAEKSRRMATMVPAEVRRFPMPLFDEASNKYASRLEPHLAKACLRSNDLGSNQRRSTTRTTLWRRKGERPVEHYSPRSKNNKCLH
jgi:hypothetical protein